MSNFKYLVILVLFSTLSFKLWASQIAIVVTKKAIIYAHPDLTAPLGVVSKGKKLHAAESFVANGKALPFQLGDKVAFISLDDVITENGHHIPLGKAPKEGIEHEVINKFESKHDNDFTKNNYFIFEVGKTMFLQGDWVKFNQFLSDEKPGLAHDYSVYIQHRPANLNHYVAVGLNYIYQNTSELFLSAPILVGDLFISAIKTDIFSLDLGLSLYGSGELQIKAGSPKKRFKGSLFGAGPKINIRLFPNKFIGFHISARYQYFRILHLEDLEIPGIGTNISLDEMNNASILLGVSIQLM
jgi:hypothetical protein